MVVENTITIKQKMNTCFAFGLSFLALAHFYYNKVIILEILVYILCIVFCMNNFVDIKEENAFKLRRWDK